MAQLHGQSLKAYIDTIVKDWDANDPSVVHVRKNNANSKWLRLIAVTNRIPAIYKVIMLVVFSSARTITKDEPNGKKSVIHFRKMVSEAVGPNGLAFSPSPGNLWLKIKETDITCLFEEFDAIVTDKNNNYPEQLVQIVLQFRLIESAPDTLTNVLRDMYGEVFKKLPEDIAKELIKKNMDPDFKELINKFKWVQDPKRAKELVFKTIGQNIKRETGFDIFGEIAKFDDLGEFVIKHIGKKTGIDISTAKRIYSIPRIMITPKTIVMKQGMKLLTKTMGKQKITSVKKVIEKGKGIKKLKK